MSIHSETPYTKEYLLGANPQYSDVYNQVKGYAQTAFDNGWGAAGGNYAPELAPYIAERKGFAPTTIRIRGQDIPYGGWAGYDPVARPAGQNLTADDIALRYIQQIKETEPGNLNYTSYKMPATTLSPDEFASWATSLNSPIPQSKGNWKDKVRPYAGLALGLATLGGATPLAGIGDLFGGGALGGAAMAGAGGLLSGAQGKDLWGAMATGGLGGALSGVGQGAQTAGNAIKGPGLAATMGNQLGTAANAVNKGGGGMDFSNILNSIQGAFKGASTGNSLNDLMTMGLRSYITNPSSPLTGLAAQLGGPALQSITGDSGILNDIGQGWVGNREYGLNGQSGALWGGIGSVAGQQPGSLADSYIKSQQYGMTPQQALMATLMGQPIDRQLAAGLTTDNWTPELLQQFGGQGQAQGQAGASGGTAGQTGGLGGGLEQLLGVGGAGGALSGLLGSLGGGLGGGALGSLMPLLLPYLASTLGGKSDSGGGGAAGVPDDTLSALQRTSALDSSRQTKELMDAQRASMLRRGLGNSGIYDFNERQLLSDIARQQQAANDQNTIAASQNALTWQNRADAESQRNQDARSGLVGTLLPLLFPQGPSSVIQNIMGGSSASAGGTGGTGATTAAPATSYLGGTGARNTTGMATVYNPSGTVAGYDTGRTSVPFNSPQGQTIAQGQFTQGQIPANSTGGIMPSAWDTSIFNPGSTTPSIFGSANIGRLPSFRNTTGGY